MVAPTNLELYKLEGRRELRPLLLRWAFVVTVLLLEGTLLGIRFEGPEAGSAWWSVLLAHASNAAHLGIAAAAAALVLYGGQLRRELANAQLDYGLPPRPWRLFAAHLAAFAVFVRLTRLLLEADLGVATSGLWFVAWLVSGAVAVGLCIGTVVAAQAVAPLLRQLARPLLVGIGVGGVAWVAAQLAAKAWLPLSWMTLWTVHAIVATVASDAVVAPQLLHVGTERFSVEIAPQCSGYEGIGLMCVLLGAYLWVYRAELRFPLALVLLPIGVVVAWVLNALRISALIGVGTWLSPTIALGGFHSYSGWLLFSAGALGMVAAARRSAIVVAPAVAPSRQTANPAAAYLVPFLVLIVAGMLIGAFTTAGFDPLYPVKVVAVAVALWFFRAQYGALRWSFSWTAVGGGVAVFVLWLVLENTTTASGEDVRAGVASLSGFGAIVWLAFRVIGSVVTVPIAEELAFRGFLLRRLVDADFDRVTFRHFTWTSFVISSVLFGAMHNRLLAGTLAGAAYALVMHRRGELGDAVVAHATTNALIAVYVLALGAWGLWA